MAFPEFVQCCSEGNERFGEAVTKVGESGIRSLIRAWGGLSPIEKEATIAAASAGAVVLGAALAALGIEAAEAVAILLLSFGVGAAMGILMGCSNQL